MMMMDGRKNQKDFMSIVRETYKDFAENTSIHGLKYTVKSDIGLCEKTFWIAVVLLGLSASGYMTTLFWNRYTSNPTRTSIQTAYAPLTTLSFPAVTICNINRIIHSKVEKFIEKLDFLEKNREIVERAFPQLMAFANPGLVEYNITDLNTLQDVLIKNEYYDMRQVIKRVSPSCNEMLVKCTWNFTSVSCAEIFEDSMSLDGFCCSFNYVPSSRAKTPVKYSIYSGSHSGLRVLLNPMIQTVQHLTLHSSGLKVIIHRPSDYPGAESISKIVSGGRQSHLQILGSKIICSEDMYRLPFEQRQCCYPEEKVLSYFWSYSAPNCLTECDIRFIYKKCNCVPYLYAFSGLPVCNITSIPCLDEMRRTSQTTTIKKCDCPPQCEDEFYNVLSTTAKFDLKNTWETSSFLLAENITDENILLRVYFMGQRQTILYRDVITSTIYLLSSFGGVYSLFLGCSFITIVEIIYYCTLRLVVNLKIFAQIDKTVPKTRDFSQVIDKETERRNVRKSIPIKRWNEEGNIFLN